MMWAPARNAAPASSAMLSANLGPAEAEVTALEQEHAAINDALPNLAGDLAALVAAQTRLAEIDALLPVKRRTVEAIRNAIPEAEMRERREAVVAEIETQGRASRKMGRGLEARYTKAAEALADVLTEIAADNRAWELLEMRAREVEVRCGESAERQVRKEAGVRPNRCWYSLTEGIVVRDWEGRVLFGGNVGTYF